MTPLDFDRELWDMMDALSHPDRDVLSAMGLEPLYCLRRVAVNENMS